MDSSGLDTRWWNLSAGVLAASVLGCGPTIVLIGDTEADTQGDDGRVDADGIDPTGMMACTTSLQCEANQVCVDSFCVDNQSDEYSDEQVDYSDYSDEYSDEVVDYSDYSDEFYCYQYGPNGECCDYYQCPQYCYDANDCDVDQACVAGSSEQKTCVQVLDLGLCPQFPPFTPLPLDPAGSEIVALAFVDIDPGPGEALVVAGALGGADLVRFDDPMPQLLPLAPVTPIVDVVAGDMNADTIADLIVADADGSIIVLQGDGVGDFSVVASLVGVSGIVAIHPLDFDGDGALDIAVHRQVGDPLVVFNDGLGNLVGGTDLLTNFVRPVSGLAVGRFLGGLDDVATSTDALDYVFGGTAKPPAQLGPSVFGLMWTPQGARSLLAADFDGDGIDAIIGTTPLQGWTLLESTRPQGEMRYAVPGPSTGLDLADMDADGDPDLIVVGSQALWIRGVSGIATASVFDCTRSIADDLSGSTVAAVGDFDGDGFPDLAVGDGTELSVRLNPDV